MNRQKLALAILLLALIGAVIYGYSRMPRQRTVAKLTFVPGMTAKPRKATAPPAQSDNTRVMLELLNQQRAGFAGSRRNIFKPLYSEPTKLPPLPPPPPPPLVKEKAKPIVPVVSPPPPVQSPVGREMAQFTFLGFLKKDNRKMIFLSKDKEIFVVKKGDKIGGKYEAANITDEALTISILPDGGEIIIPLVENRPLTAPRR
jgi:hypothetical protein